MKRNTIKFFSLITVVLLVLTMLSIPTFARTVTKGGDVTVNFYRDPPSTGGGGGSGRPDKPDQGPGSGGGDGLKEDSQALKEIENLLIPETGDKDPLVEVASPLLDVREKKLPATGSNNLLILSLLTVSTLAFAGYVLLNKKEQNTGGKK